MAVATHSAMNVAVAVKAVRAGWQGALPVVERGGVVLRELHLSDAAALFEMLSCEEVSRFISPPPTSVEGFERFIAWAQTEREAGRYACFAVIPAGLETAIGLIQIRQLDPGFETAEWGFAIGSAFWGTGVFPPAATAAVEFAFETIGVSRLEARAALANGRGNGALAKVGAVREAVLRKSFKCRGEYLDQALWSILREDWQMSKAVWGAAID
jgi:RimJ/RimL family protein N-acetyltransferase